MHTPTKKNINSSDQFMSGQRGNSDRKKYQLIPNHARARREKSARKFALFMCISRILGRSNKSIDKRAAKAQKFHILIQFGAFS